jgi:hypothetical protein
MVNPRAIQYPGPLLSKAVPVQTLGYMAQDLSFGMSLGERTMLDTRDGGEDRSGRGINSDRPPAN